METKLGYNELLKKVKELESEINRMKKLEASNTKKFYQEIIENVQDGIWTTDKEDVIFYANKGMEQIAGIPREQIIGKNVITDFPEETTKKFNKFYLKARKTLKPQWYEVEVTTPSGQKNWQNGWIIPNVKDGEFDGIITTIRDITLRKEAEIAEKKHLKKLKEIEWLLNPTKQVEHQEQSYGDLTELNSNGLIKKTIEKETLQEISDDFMHLLGTSSAIYERNGDYAYGIFTSGWCRLLDNASFKLCKTTNNNDALHSGNWLCHESCWEKASERAIQKNEIVDTPCSGGIHLYAVPIETNFGVIGSINFGYGNPPTDDDSLKVIADKYKLDYNEVQRASKEYKNRPEFIVQIAKDRIKKSAKLIAEKVEKKLADQALIQSEEKFRNAFNHNATGMALVSHEGKFLEVNNKICEIFGYSKEEMLSKTYKELTHPDEIRRSVAKYKGLLEGKYDSFEIEKRYVTKRGEIIQGRSNISMICDEENNPIFSIAQLQDITEQNRIETELKESEEKFRALYENAPLSYQSLDEDGKFIDINPTWLNTLGYKREEVIGKKYADFLHPDWIDHFNENFPEFKQRGYIHDVQFRLKHKKGHFIDVTFEGSAAYHRDGSFKQTYCVFKDITEQKKAEKELEKSQNHLKSLMENTDDCMLISDKNGYPLMFNAAYKKIMKETIGLDMKPGIKPHKLLPDKKEVEWWDNIQKRVLNGENFRVDYSLDLGNNNIKYFEFSYRPVIKNGKIQGFTEVSRDITERKLITEALRKSEDKFKEAQKVAKIGSWSYNVETQQPYWTDEMFRLFGLNPEDGAPDYEHHKKYIHPDDWDKFDKSVTNTINTGKGYDIEIRLVKPDGKTIWVNAKCKTISQNGKVVEIIGTTQDITKKKNAELKLIASEEKVKESELKYLLIADYTFDWETYYNYNTDIVFVNQSFEKITGFNTDDFKSGDISIEAFVHRDDLTNVKLVYNKLYSGEIIDSYEFRIIDKANQLKYVEICGQPVLSKSKEILGFRTSIRDISERKKTELELVKTKEKAEESEKHSKIIAEISKEIIRPELSIKKIADLTYKYALELTNSKFGYVSSIDKKNGDNVGHTLGEMMPNLCNIKNKRIAFPKSKDGYGGLWGYSLNTFESFFTNEPSKHKASKGLPLGHVPLNNFLSVPVIIKNKLLGQIALANKDGNYTNKDIKIIKEISNIYGLAIYRKNIEEELLIAKDQAEGKEWLVRKHNKRLKILLELNEMKSANTKQVYDFALEKAIELCESKIGFLGFLNEDETVVNIYSWSSSTMEACKVKNAYNNFEVEKCGIWGESIRKRRAHIINDYHADNPLKKGLPEGHVEIKNYLSIPVIDNDKIVAVIAIANKETDYNETDQNELSLLMNGMWNIIKHRRFEEEIINSKNEVEASESRLSRLIDNMNAGVAVYEVINNGQDFKFLQFNKAAERITHERKEDIIGKTLLEKFPNMNISPLFKAIQRVNITEQDMHLPPFYYKDSNRHGWRENYIYKLKTGEIVAIFEDVTKREEYQQALIDSEDKFRTIFEMAEDLICLADTEKTVFLDINPSFSKTLGYHKKELLEKSFLEFVHHDDIQKTIDIIKDELDSGKPIINFINRYRCKDGSYRWLDWNAHPIPKKKLTYAIAHDITEMKKSRDELEKHKNNLEELVSERTTQLENALNELKEAESQLIQSEKMASLGILTAGVAHEINNPLNYIQSGIYGLQSLMNHGCIMEEYIDKITHITKVLQIGVTKASAIVKGLNTFSRKGGEEKRKCEIHKIIENCLLILQHELKKKCIISKDYFDNKLLIIGNEENLQQVFVNLLMNSIHAIEKEGEIKISTKLIQDKRLAKITISDNGSGINKENLPKIFDPFFTTKPPGQGVGIGLSIAYKIINEHKGTIEYNSEISVGTDVILTFPLIDE